MLILPDTPIMRHAPTISEADAPRRDLAETTRKFEAAILSELLRAAGAAQTGSDFGGGIGEDQFASLLLDEQAQRIAAAGGIGLAELALRGILAQTNISGGAT